MPDTTEMRIKGLLAVKQCWDLKKQLYVETISYWETIAKLKFFTTELTTSQ